MIGIINDGVRSFVVDTYGQDAWSVLVEATGAPQQFVSACPYHDAVTYKLLGTLAEQQGVEMNDVLEEAGFHFNTSYIKLRGYDRILRCMGGNIVEFLQNLNGYHLHLSMSFKDMNPPAFNVSEVTPESLVFHYASTRPGLTHFAMGLIRGAAKTLYGVDVDVSVLQLRGEPLAADGGTGDGEVCDHDKLLVRFPHQPSVLEQHTAAATCRLSLDPPTLFNLFPFHIVLDRECKLVQVGRALSRMYPGMKPGRPLKDFFTVRHPYMELSFDRIKERCDSTFVLRSRCNGMEIKGQMQALSMPADPVVSGLYRCASPAPPVPSAPPTPTAGAAAARAAAAAAAMLSAAGSSLGVSAWSPTAAAGGGGDGGGGRGSATSSLCPHLAMSSAPVRGSARSFSVGANAAAAAAATASGDAAVPGGAAPAVPAEKNLMGGGGVGSSVGSGTGGRVGSGTGGGAGGGGGLLSSGCSGSFQKQWWPSPLDTAAGSHGGGGGDGGAFSDALPYMQLMSSQQPHQPVMLFLGSPRIGNVDELRTYGLFVSDLPLFDNSREMVLLAEQRTVEAALKDTFERLSVQLEEERHRAEQLLYQMIPPHIADVLRRGERAEAETYPEATVLFSDIVGFTTISAASTAMEVCNLLDQLYSEFDELLESEKYAALYKVETIGDAYMLVANVTQPCPDHVDLVLDFALDMHSVCSRVLTNTGAPLQIRVGVHSGSVVGGVVGRRMPRFHLFGDTVNTASRMESHGVGGSVHISAASRALVRNPAKYLITERGGIAVKGKGLMETFLVSRADAPTAAHLRSLLTAAASIDVVSGISAIADNPNLQHIHQAEQVFSARRSDDSTAGTTGGGSGSGLLALLPGGGAVSLDLLMDSLTSNVVPGSPTEGGGGRDWGPGGDGEEGAAATRAPPEQERLHQLELEGPSHEHSRFDCSSPARSRSFAAAAKLRTLLSGLGASGSRGGGEGVADGGGGSRGDVGNGGFGAVLSMERTGEGWLSPRPRQREQSPASRLVATTSRRRLMGTGLAREPTFYITNPHISITQEGSDGPPSPS